MLQHSIVRLINVVPNITNKLSHMLIPAGHPLSLVFFFFFIQEGRGDEHVAEVKSHDTMRVQCVLDQERPIICYSPGI